MSQSQNEMRINVVLADGSRHDDFQPGNPDMVRWDKTAAKHNWPDTQTAPFLFMTFIAWSYLARHQLYSGTFDQFSEKDCEHIENIDDEDDEGDEVNPTPPEATPDSV